MRSFEDFLASDDDRPIKMIDVDAWNASVPTRQMTGKERTDLWSLYREDKDPSPLEFNRAILSRSLCDREGRRVSPTIVDQVLNKSSLGLEQLVQALTKENALDPDSRQALLEKK